MPNVALSQVHEYLGIDRETAYNLFRGNNLPQPIPQTGGGEPQYDSVDLDGIRDFVQCGERAQTLRTSIAAKTERADRLNVHDPRERQLKGKLLSELKASRAELEQLNTPSAPKRSREELQNIIDEAKTREDAAKQNRGSSQATQDMLRAKRQRQQAEAELAELYASDAPTGYSREQLDDRLAQTESALSAKRSHLAYVETQASNGTHQTELIRARQGVADLERQLSELEATKPSAPSATRTPEQEAQLRAEQARWSRFHSGG